MIGVWVGGHHWTTPAAMLGSSPTVPVGLGAEGMAYEVHGGLTTQNGADRPFRSAIFLILSKIPPNPPCAGVPGVDKVAR
jgi:hypothetical protein